MDVRQDGKTLNVIKVRFWNFFPNLATILICKTSEIYQIHEYLPTECDGKMFGKDCKESCGKCLNNDKCHFVNGNCVNGCNPGNYEINCTKGTDTCHSS